MKRLSFNEIEKRIERYQQRIKAVKMIVPDIQDATARQTLETHIVKYTIAILELKEELQWRKKEKVPR
jgi:hypothetical protein